MINKHSFRKTCYRILLYTDATLATALIFFQPHLATHIPRLVLVVSTCILWLLAVLLFHLSTLVGRKPHADES